MTVQDWSQAAKLVGHEAAERGGVDITEADVLVAGGRGLGGPENFALCEALAKALGGEVAATRAVVDAGWYPYAAQVGQTGKTVTPKLYVACGISGAIQHKVGMAGAGTIVAINKDANAPIFEYADLGVVGDLHQILPKLTELIAAPQGLSAARSACTRGRCRPRAASAGRRLAVIAPHCTQFDGLSLSSTVARRRRRRSRRPPPGTSRPRPAATSRGTTRRRGCGRLVVAAAVAREEDAGELVERQLAVGRRVLAARAGRSTGSSASRCNFHEPPGSAPRVMSIMPGRSAPPTNRPLAEAPGACCAPVAGRSRCGCARTCCVVAVERARRSGRRRRLSAS